MNEGFDLVRKLKTAVGAKYEIHYFNEGLLHQPWNAREAWEIIS